MVQLTPPVSEQSYEIRRQVADFLVAAGDYMAEHHKCSGVAGTEDGRVCAWGAMCKVTSQPGWRARMGIALSEYLDQKCKCIPDWSDSHSEEEVIQGFYDAAVKLRPDATL